jgi:hypothetical protein
MNYRSAAHEACAKAFNPFRALGHIPDADHKRRQKDASLRLGVNPVSAPRAGLAHLEAPIGDQGGASACGGFSGSQVVYTSAAASGLPLPFVPSMKLAYALARILELQDASQLLTDSGVMMSDMLTVFRQFGVMPIGSDGGMAPDGRYSDVWTDDDTGGSVPANINDKPDLMALETAGLKLVTGEYRIDEGGPNAISQLQASLAGVIAKPAAAQVGIFVDTKNFMQWDPSTGPIAQMDLTDPQGGGHALAITYYYTTASGVIVIGGPNSWSTSWPNGPNGKGPPESPYWKPGHWEITAPCLQKVWTDCLLYPIQVIS